MALSPALIHQRGLLRHIAAIQTPTEVRTDAGGFTISWGTESTRRARLRWLTGREVMEAAQTKGLADAVIEMDRIELTERNRIVLTDTVTGSSITFEVKWCDFAEGEGRKVLVYCVRSSNG